MKCMHMPSSKCVLFWFFSIQLLKKHTLNPEFTLFVSISCSKSPVLSSQNLLHKFFDWKWPHPPRNFFENSSDSAQPSFPKNSFKSAEMHLRHTEVAGCLQAPSPKSRILTTKFPWFRLIYLQRHGCDQLSDEAKVGFIFQDKSPPKLPAGKKEHSIMHNKWAKLMS